MTIGIAGAGRVAQALGRHLQEHGHAVTQVASRSMDQARSAATFIGGAVEAVAYSRLTCERILIAVPDRAISGIADALASATCPPRMVLHCSGAYGASLLDGLRAQGVSCGALHPLQTFASAEAGYRALPGSSFAIDGDPDALAWAEQIAAMLHGPVLRIPEAARAIYHAAAAMASNHLTSVLDAAVQMMRQAGVSEDAALRALAPIAQAALTNTLRTGPTQALTGPVERGDVATVSRHLAALRVLPQTVQDLYRAAGLQALSIACRRGLNHDEAGHLRAALQGEQHV